MTEIKTPEQFIARMQELYAQNVEISKRKNADYGGARSPFANFMLAEQLGIPAEKAILVRMCDKLSRIATLLDAEAQVEDEKLADTLLDLANYSIILRMLYESRH